MSQEPRPTVNNLFTQVDISPSGSPESDGGSTAFQAAQAAVLQEILQATRRQTALLEELVAQTGALQRQRQTELEQWKQANPVLARKCRQAADALSRAQSEFLDRLTEEVSANPEGLADGDFLLSEFVDRFGPRLAHLNGMLQVLSQLGAQAAAVHSTKT